jgi:predicted DNA-binding transcriptional regulator AlpA
MAELDQQLTNFPKFLTRKQVCAIVGVTYPSIWGWVRAGHFPPGRKLGIGSGNRNKIVWLESEVLSWMQTRPLQLPKGTVKVYGQPSDCFDATVISPNLAMAKSETPPAAVGRKVNKKSRRR